jgi:tetratricopeptide (TPR) repeat protein
LADSENDSWRVEALILLAEFEPNDPAAELLEEALRHAASRPALQSLIHCRLAWAKRYRPGLEHAGAALELAERLDDDVLRQRARAVQAILRWFVGQAEAPADLPELAQHLPGALGGERLVQEATQAMVNTLAPSSKRDEARAMLEREYREWRERDEPRSARALWGLAWVEFWAGRWELAAEHAARAHDIGIQYGLEVPQDHLPIAVIAVYRGQLELASEHSRRALDLADKHSASLLPQHHAVLGLAALWSGDPAAALEWLGEAERRAAVVGWGEPTMRWWTADHAELLLELGRIDDAAQLLDVWEADAVRVARAWVLADVTRTRGLVAAARGDVEHALRLFEQAVAEHDAVGDPFGRARALLALGTTRRRTRQKRPARVAIEAALEGFETIGAEGWATKARAELGRIGGRTRAEGLTAAERRVASLVAEGERIERSRRRSSSASEPSPAT